LSQAETSLRVTVRGFIETMIEEELDTALSRPRYGRRLDLTAADNAAAPIVGHDADAGLLRLASEAYRTVDRKVIQETRLTSRWRRTMLELFIRRRRPKWPSGRRLI
jgi:hypothetical protein